MPAGLADVPTDSYRTSRAAGENIIPAVTNTAEILTQALPQLEGKLAVVALNVPVVDGSTVDLTTETDVESTVAEVNARGGPEVEARLPGSHRIRGRPDRVLGCQAQLTFRCLRQPGDHGDDGQPGEDHHLVQQRMGLFAPGSGSNDDDRRLSGWRTMKW